MQPFEAELILPEQLIHDGKPACGELAIAYECLWQAVGTLTGQLGCTEREFLDDYRWATSGSDDLYSFRHLCALFGISPEYLLPAVLAGAERARGRIRNGHVLPDLSGPMARRAGWRVLRGTEIGKEPRSRSARPRPERLAHRPAQGESERDRQAV
jgi:hypothetical protein